MIKSTLVAITRSLMADTLLPQKPPAPAEQKPPTGPAPADNKDDKVSWQ